MSFPRGWDGVGRSVEFHFEEAVKKDVRGGGGWKFALCCAFCCVGFTAAACSRLNPIFTSKMLKLSQPFTTIDPAQGPPTTSRNDGDVSREVAEAEEEETRDVGVSNIMAPSIQTDPSSLFDPTKYSHHTGEKQEVKESSQRIHTPCPVNRRVNAADDRKRLQTTAETVPSEK